jgi:hypothetical protein
MAPSDDVALAARELVVSILRNPTLDVGISASLFTLIAWGTQQITGEGPSRFLVWAAGVYDFIAMVVAIKAMLARLLPSYVVDAVVKDLRDRFRQRPKGRP